jgi:hypothetical protein
VAASVARQPHSSEPNGSNRHLPGSNAHENNNGEEPDSVPVGFATKVKNEFQV